MIRKTPAGCPVCCGSQTHPFLAIPAVPVLVGTLWPTQHEALAAPMGEIELALCGHCGLIFNQAYDPARIAYAPGYEISLDHSPVYQAYVQETAVRLLETYKVRHKQIVELGCGKGYFLKTICRLGANDGLGIDPAIGEEHEVVAADHTIRFVRGRYSTADADVAADLVCCRSVLELIPDPCAFVTTVREVMGQRHEAIVYFELPNAAFVFGPQATWNVFYEHCTYLTPATLAHLFRLCGFEVLRVAPCYVGGQYVEIDAKPATKPQTALSLPAHELSALTALITQYAERYEQRVSHWQRQLAQLQVQGKRVVAWGSGGRGITFLNTLQTQTQVAYVVDVNPARQGQFIPGTGQQVVAPAFLAEVRPDVVIITNPTYAQEIQQQTRELGVRCEFLLA
jgi:hypothetical protein